MKQNESLQELKGRLIQKERDKRFLETVDQNQRAIQRQVAEDQFWFWVAALGTIGRSK